MRSRRPREQRQPDVQKNFLDTESGKDYFSIMEERWRKLTPREKEVASLYVQGRTYREIAEASDVSSKTVRAQLVDIYNRLGIHKETELTRLWMYFEEGRYDPNMPDGDEDTRM